MAADLESAYDTMSALLQAAGDELESRDRQLLLTHADQLEAIADHEKERIGAMFGSAWQGFFTCAVRGQAFVATDRIKSQLGRTLENNYPGASEAFLRFATSYWTLKMLADDLSLDTRYQQTAIQQLFRKIETDIASVFFPTPGPVRVSARKRQQAQRRLLLDSGVPIDIEEFMTGNPILAASPRRTGCAAVIGALVLVAAIAFVWLFR